MASRSLFPLTLGAATVLFTGCAAPTRSSTIGAPGTPAPPAIEDPSVPFPGQADAGSAGLSVIYPVAWDTAVEVPFAPAEVPPEGPVVITEHPEEPLVLDAPVELDGDVLFASGTATISDQADAELRLLALAAEVELGPAQVLIVDGHVDDVGTPDFNRRLGTERADAVVSRLLRHAPSLFGRIVGRGHGEDELLDPSCLGDCPSNRRVVVSVEP